jgi:hypothetical protein
VRLINKMKITRFKPVEQGFTLSEFSVSMAIFFFVTAGLLTTFIFGLKMNELTQAKLGASAGGRKALAYLVDEIRSARRVRVGVGNANAFTEAGLAEAQQGNALQIHATTNLNEWVRYYHDPVDEAVMRVTDSALTPVAIVKNITNAIPFRAEDFLGNVQTNTQNNRVMSVDLIFSQVPFAPEYADYYRLRFKVTRRRIQ